MCKVCEQNMSSQNELISRMMSRLDENTDMIPEGFYLEFCGYLGKLYNEKRVVEVVPDERRACSYCRRPGHNRRTCEVMDMDDQRKREMIVINEKIERYKRCKESFKKDVDNYLKDRDHLNEKIREYNESLKQFSEEKEKFESRVKSMKSFIDGRS